MKSVIRTAIFLFVGSVAYGVISRIELDIYQLIGVFAIGITLIIVILRSPWKKKKPTRVIVQYQYLPDGSTRIIPTALIGLPWVCSDIRHKLECKLHDGRIMVVCSVVRATVFETRYAISINGKEPPPEEWTTNEIVEIRYDQYGLHMTYQQSVMGTAHDHSIPWPGTSAGQL